MRDFGVSFWKAIAKRGTKVTFAKGEVLMRQGEASTHCYALTEGEVLVTTLTSHGATVVLGRRTPGAVLGELGVLTESARSAEVRADSPVTAYVLTGDDLELLLREEPDIAVGEVKRLARQLRSLSDRYALRSEDVRARAAALLATHAAESGDSVFQSTRAEFASWIGASREAATRALADLEAEGFIGMRRGAVEVLDLDGLQTLS